MQFQCMFSSSVGVFYCALLYELAMCNVVVEVVVVVHGFIPLLSFPLSLSTLPGKSLQWQDIKMQKTVSQWLCCV